MRILHVVHQYPPDHIAGTELYTRWLANCQAEANHHVAVFTPLNRHKSIQPDSTLEEGVRIYRRSVGARSSTAVFLNSFRQTQLTEDFTAVLAVEQPEIVHIQHLMGLPVAIPAALRQMGVPYVIFLHDYWYGCANGQLLTNDRQLACEGPDPRFHNCGRCAVARAGLEPAAGLLGPLTAPLMRRRNELLGDVFDGAARLIAPNEFVMQTYKAMGFSMDRMVIIPMGVESPPMAGRSTTRRAGSGGLRLGYLGSISPQKGLHVLVEAMNGLPPDQIALDIYGDLSVFPDYAAGLQQRATHPGIHFGGRLDRAQVWAALAELDALIFPTLWYEASPFIIREAFAAGVPIIASKIGAPATMIRDGIDGFLFPAGDASALRSILAMILSQPSRLDEMRRAIMPPPTLAEHAATIEKLYREVIDETRHIAPIRK